MVESNVGEANNTGSRTVEMDEQISIKLSGLQINLTTMKRLLE